MVSIIEQHLGKDMATLLECLFQSGKHLHDYKISGNKIGCTILLRLSDLNIPQARFPAGKSPSKQLRDQARHIDHKCNKSTSTPKDMIQSSEANHSINIGGSFIGAWSACDGISQHCPDKGKQHIGMSPCYSATNHVDRHS